MCTSVMVPPSCDETSMPWNARAEPIAAIDGVQSSLCALVAATVLGGGAALAMKPLMISGFIVK